MRLSKIERMGPETRLAIGKIVGVHGIKGEVRVYSYMESTDLFDPGSQVYAVGNDGAEKRYTVKSAKPYKKLIRMAFAGIDDRSAAEALVGEELSIQRSALPETEEGSWYWCDLIGLGVYTEDDVYVGRVESMIATGSNDVFVVRDDKRDDPTETLIPAIDGVVIDIDLDAGRMRVRLPEEV